MIKLVIFDMDGTLLDSMWVWRGASGRYLKSIGIDCDEDLSHILFKMTIKDAVGYLHEHYLPDMSWDEINTGVKGQIAGAYINVFEKKGATALLKALKKEGIKTVLATASPDKIVSDVTNRLDIAKYFDKIVPNSVKTTPDLFLELAKEFSAHPDETVVAEDALYAIRTAHSAGFKVMAVYEEFFGAYQDKIKELSDLYYKTIDNTDRIIKDIKNL